MFVPTSTMIAIFSLLAVLSGVVIWLLILASQLSAQIQSCFKYAGVLDDDLIRADALIADLYDEMGLDIPQVVEPDEELEVPDFLREAA
ncbi:hypothetical protein CHUV2995_00946 [Corynebacterium diphtheriae subsp. lausannense]|uniref:hypothetical protein n=1 Tax=Corynebacterium belfantii TaxID=2014537 RepID=UPI000DC1BFC3|nr:hypothetical protein [Corynebacterium belfantii]MBG9309883.1 hypothetical protein [Corynebacterium belfantii]MBG9349175.1 hypothetical protein [Corynebacterium belfantii]QVI97749.1 hypothetical protein KFR76_09095 [Corynebacterium diphtheriae]SPJ40160.1 hypothetical protein CHUV2995_00946 [Corynebacterium diphtheriae subsp. lausannense]